MSTNIRNLRKVLIIGLAAGLGMALENSIRGEQRIAQSYAVRRREQQPEPELSPPVYMSPRKSKGEKKRAAAQRKQKGWGR